MRTREVTDAVIVISHRVALQYKESCGAVECTHIKCVRQILKLNGIDDTPIFKRNRISNQKEQVEMVMQAANYLDDETLLVYREGSGVPFEIVSCHNVQNRGEWLEVTVQRKVTAR